MKVHLLACLLLVGCCTWLLGGDVIVVECGDFKSNGPVTIANRVYSNLEARAWFNSNAEKFGANALIVLWFNGKTSLRDIIAFLQDMRLDRWSKIKIGISPSDKLCETQVKALGLTLLREEPPQMMRSIEDSLKENLGK